MTMSDFFNLKIMLTQYTYNGIEIILSTKSLENFDNCK